MEYKKVERKINNIVNDNVKMLAQLFPSAVKDGEIDFEALKEELGEFQEVGSEKYELTWAGKQNAKKVAQEDVYGKTLKFIPEDSLYPETTENLYIEGDNLEVLKLIRQNYYGAIKMIYIDPPYNTGNDFVYNDDYRSSLLEINLQEEIMGNDGERYSVNSKSQNRYHAKWLNMMYSRLKIAKDLLNNQGIIFMSIDECEYHRLKSLCDEIFGEENSVADLVWQNKKGGGNDSTYVAIEHEYILVYAKNISELSAFYEMYSDEYLKRYKEEDENGKFYWDTFKRKSGKQYYPITCPDGTILQYDNDGNLISWLRSEARFINDLKIGDARIVQIGDKWSVQFKQRLPKGKTPRSIFKGVEIIDDQGTTSTGGEDVYSYFGKDVFSNPKPVKLLEFIIGFGLQDGEIIMDFFSGSGTVAEAVMNANLIDSGKRKFIAVQIEEDLDKVLANTAANKRLIVENAIEYLDSINKPHLLTELGKERIRKAGEAKIEKSIEGHSLDVGFKVFRVSETNIKWNLLQQIENVQMTTELLSYTPDLMDFVLEAKDIDIVYELMLRQKDVTLSSSIEQLNDIGERTYLYASSYLVCLESQITKEIIDKLSELNPLPIKFIFRDSAFGDNIALKDETFRRLKALIEKNAGSSKITYTVEFI